MTKFFQNAIFFCSASLFLIACGANNATVAGADNTASGLSEGKYYNPAISYGTLKDGRDGQVYRTVQIGEQTWMAENLNFDYNVGTAASYCYNNSKDSSAKYGRLYTWSAAMDSAAIFSDGGKGCGYGATCTVNGKVQGVCPAGWHLPDTREYEALAFYVEFQTTDDAGYVLKATSGWRSHNGVSGDGSDEFGFGALPAGYGSVGRNEFEFYGVLLYTDFWTSSSSEVCADASYGSDDYYAACVLPLYASSSTIGHEGNGLFYKESKSRAYPIRCMKD